MEAIASLYEAIDELNKALINRASSEKKPVACRKGCSWCCSQAVFAVSHELDYLNTYLENKLPAAQLTKIRKRAEAKLKVTSALSQKERLLHKAACPLLENGACIAYEARPMACRIYLSSDEASCINEFRHPENHMEFPALFSFPLQAGRMMNEGFTAALREMGYRSEELPLEQGLTLIR